MYPLFTLLRTDRPRRLPPVPRLLMLLLVWAAVSCSQTPRETLPSEAFEREGPIQESWEVLFHLREDGLDRLEIRAGYMAKYETSDSTYTVLTPDADTGRVQVVWFDRSGVRQGTMYSDKLHYYESEQRLLARGNVVALTVDSTRLETDRLRWERETESLHAPGFARIITPTERIRGYELVSDEQLDNYSLARVTGQVRIKEGSN